VTARESDAVERALRRIELEGAHPDPRAAHGLLHTSRQVIVPGYTRIGGRRCASPTCRTPSPRSVRRPWRTRGGGWARPPRPAGEPCGGGGSDSGAGTIFAGLLALPTLRTVPFCPERYRMGVPRTMPDLHGGDGFAVLDGEARVLDEHGTDLTEPMIAGANA